MAAQIGHPCQSRRAARANQIVVERFRRQLTATRSDRVGDRAMIRAGPFGDDRTDADWAKRRTAFFRLSVAYDGDPRMLLAGEALAEASKHLAWRGRATGNGAGGIAAVDCAGSTATPFNCKRSGATGLAKHSTAWSRSTETPRRGSLDRWCLPASAQGWTRPGPWATLGPMSHWPLNRDDIRRPAYRSLAQGIASAIGAGTLRPGTRLPTHRQLAFQMGVSVQTVSRAYEELIRADLVSGEVGRGTFVQADRGGCDRTPWQGTDVRRAPTNLSLMTPVRLPGMTEAWRESLLRVAARMPEAAMHIVHPEEVSARYADLASAWMARCGLVAGKRRVMMTNGVTPAMLTALSMTAGPGDVIASDRYTSRTVIAAAQHQHLSLKAIESDALGMIPEALIAAARGSAGRMRAVCLCPNGAGPETRVIDRDRRAALALAAQEAGLWVLECDPLGPLPIRRPPPVASLAPDRTFYCTGMSKSLSPGLRLGVLAVPEAMVRPLFDRHLTVSQMATPLVAEIAADWLDSGTADTLLEAQRAELAARNRMALRILGARSLGGPYGLHRWVPLPPSLGEDAMVTGLMARHVIVAPGRAFRVSGDGQAIRVCIGAAGRRRLEQALSHIAEILSAAQTQPEVASAEGRDELS